MRRGLAALALALWMLALGAEQAGAQATRKRPAPRASESATKPAAEAPAKRRDEGKGAPVTVDADQLESLQKEGLVIFTGNVVARQNSSTQYADRMEVYLDASGDRIVRTVSTGTVKIITRDCRVGTARRAEYYDAEQRVVLMGNARVWQEDNVVTGERITIYLAEDRSLVEGGRQERVKAVFYPKRDEGKLDGKADGKAPRPASAPCPS